VSFTNFVSINFLLQLFTVSALATANTNTHVTDHTISSLWKQFMVSSEANIEARINFPYQECFKSAAEKYELPVTLLLAVARGESDFNPEAVSYANARGLMQILWPGTAHHLGIYDQKQLFDPCINIDAGARYLVELLSMYDGDVHLSLAAYNYGPGRVSPSGRAIPSKAVWYSKYIYQHLNFIVNLPEDKELLSARTYDNIKRILLIAFNQPHLAELFITRTQAKVPDLRLELFKSYFGQYRVMLISGNGEELERNRQALLKVGFRIEEAHVYR
jgi:hypothetical protein